jgi:hypothetical protein
MFRPAIGTLIIAAALGMAGQATAELPMSPAFRTEQAAVTGKSQPPPATPKPEKQIPAGKAAAAKPAASEKAVASEKVVATAPIPPPLAPSIPAAAKLPATPSSTAAVEHTAAPPHNPHHMPRPHYAFSHYRYFHSYYGAGAASNLQHLGPNPYSDSGD